MLQMKYGVFGLRLSIYTQSLKEKENFKTMAFTFKGTKTGPIKPLHTYINDKAHTF